jgi:hypothetical protein
MVPKSTTGRIAERECEAMRQSAWKGYSGGLPLYGVLGSSVTLSAEDAPDFAVYYHRQEYLTGPWETGWAG